MAQAIGVAAYNALIAAAVSVAISAIINAMTPPIRNRGPRLEELQAQQSQYGVFIPSIFGTFKVAGTVIWIEGNEYKELEDTETIGGKGGGNSVKTTRYSYSVTLAVMVGDGETEGIKIEGIKRIWADTTLIYDRSDQATTNNVYASASIVDSIRIYTGTEDQLPDPRIEAEHPNCPAFRGKCYVVFEDFIVEKFGRRIPQFRFEPTTIEPDIPYILEELSPEAFEKPDFAAILPIESSWYPVYVQGGVIYYELSGNPTETTGPAVNVAIGRKTIDGIVISQEEIEQDLNDSKDLLGFTNISAGYPTCTVRNSPPGTVYRVYLAAGSKDDFPLSQTRTFLAKRGFMSGLHTINADEDFLRQRIKAGFYHNNVIYLITRNPSSGGGGGWCWGVSTGGSTLYETEISTTNACQHLYVNEDGVYILLETGSTPTELQLWDHTLTTRIATWANLANFWAAVSLGTIGAFTTNGSFFEVNAQAICLFGSFGNDLHISAGMLHRFGSIGYVIPKGLLASDLDLQTNTQGIGLGLDVFNAGGATIVCGNAFTGNLPSLGEVVSAMAQSADIAAADIDVTSLTDDVKGFAITSLETMASNLRPLQTAYPFDVIESDWKIKFVRRGGAAIKTLTIDDLGAAEYEDQQPDALKQTIENELALPRQVNVLFQHEDRNYDVGAQSQTRLVTQSKHVWQQELPIVSNDAEAVKIADVVIYAAWLERNVFEFFTSLQQVALEPTDVVTIDLDGVSHSIRLAEMDFGRPGIMQCKGVAQDASNYTSVAETQAGTEYTPPQILFTGDVARLELVLLDLPLLRDEDEDLNPGMYAALYPSNPSFYDSFTGAFVYGTDGGKQSAGEFSPYDQLGYTEDRAIPCIVQSVTSTAVKNTVVDKANTINVKMLGDDQLTSLSDQNFLNGKNVLLYRHLQTESGDKPEYEVVFFKNAVLELDGTYTLSHLLRGQFDTVIGTAAPVVHSFIARVDTLTRVPLGDEDLNARFYKAVPVGGSVVGTEPDQTAFNRMSSTPLAPVHVRANRNAAGDITIRWIRKNRTEGDWKSLADVPNTEDTETYRIYLYDDMGDFIRSIDVTDATEYTYIAADQTTDYGGVQAKGALDIGLAQVASRNTSQNNMAGFQTKVSL